MEEIDWSKAPEGATHYHPKMASPWLRIKAGSPQYHHPECGWQNYGSECAGFAHIAEAVARPAEQESAWTGASLPPVGTVCEFLSGGHWFEVEVKYSSEWLTVIKCLKNKAGSAIDQKDVELALDAFDLEEKLRPIRTPEQIAAEEREMAVEAMLALDPYLPNTPLGMMSRADFCRALYDHGYRKVEGGAQ